MWVVELPYSQQCRRLTSVTPQVYDSESIHINEDPITIVADETQRLAGEQVTTQRHLELDPGLHTRIHTLVSAQEPPFLHTRAPSLTVHARERHYLSNRMERYYTLPRRWPHSSPHNVIFESVTSAGIFPRVGLT